MNITKFYLILQRFSIKKLGTRTSRPHAGGMPASQNPTMKGKGQYTQGIFLVVMAYVSWGFLPLFWKQLEAIPAVEILAHRILWSSVFTMAVCLVMKRKYLRNYFSCPKALGKLLVTGVIVSMNWGVFIYAVNSGQLIEASLGYFINPLVSVLLGMVFLGEKLNKIQIAAFALAMIGVAYLTLNYGHFPWIAIVLALTFGVYGLLKKKMNYDSMSALAVETTLVAPFALAYLFFSAPVADISYVTQHIPVGVMLVLAGVVTALPLYWFGIAAVRIPLYSVGFFQYIAPTMKLIIGIYFFHEIFSITHFVSFLLIWAGLALYIGDMVVRLNKKH